MILGEQRIERPWIRYLLLLNVLLQSLVAYTALVIYYLSDSVCQDFGRGCLGVQISVPPTRLQCRMPGAGVASKAPHYKVWYLAGTREQPGPQTSLPVSASMWSLQQGGFQVAQSSKGVCLEKEHQASPWTSYNVTSIALVLQCVRSELFELLYPSGEKLGIISLWEECKEFVDMF